MRKYNAVMRVFISFERSDSKIEFSGCNTGTKRIGINKIVLRIKTADLDDSTHDPRLQARKLPFRLVDQRQRPLRSSRSLKGKRRLRTGDRRSDRILPVPAAAK